MTLKNTNYEQVKIYLLPVGEGLSVLLHSKELTFLYDTGNRFRQFDAGKQIIIPSLQNLNIQNIDYIILSNDNWQHIGGNRTTRGNFPEARMLAYSKLLPFLDKGFSCEGFYYEKQNILIEAITTFSTSCGFKITLFDHTELYLISDITKIEWLQFTSELIQEEKIKNSNLSRKKDYFEQERFIHSSKIFLFPHQGKRDYPMRELLQNFSDITFLFSTKRIDTKVSQQLSKTDHSIYNAYYGVIEISIPKINAKPYRRFRIKEFSDKKRFWWYSPIH